jgi:hypothetical protein
MNSFISITKRFFVGLIFVLMIISNAKATVVIPNVESLVSGYIALGCFGCNSGYRSFFLYNFNGSSSSGGVSLDGSSISAQASFLPDQMITVSGILNSNIGYEQEQVSGNLDDWIHFSGLSSGGYITENIYSYWELEGGSASYYVQSNIFNYNNINIFSSNPGSNVFFSGNMLDWNSPNGGPPNIGSNLITISIPTNDIIQNNDYIPYIMGVSLNISGIGNNNTDPLISFIVPPGVTITSGSGYNYLNPINPNSNPLAATPEPPTFWLMATGLLGMFGWVGYRRMKATA